MRESRAPTLRRRNIDWHLWTGLVEVEVVREHGCDGCRVVAHTGPTLVEGHTVRVLNEVQVVGDTSSRLQFQCSGST